MKILMMSMFFILLSVSAYGEEFFPNVEIKDLRIISVNTDDGHALVQDQDGNEAEVNIGDTVGSDAGIVIEINDALIIIQIGDTQARVPVKQAIGKGNSSTE